LKVQLAHSPFDYIRANLFDPAKMKPLAHNIPGPDNDLNEKISRYIEQAIGDENASVYAFGARWGPEGNKRISILVFCRETVFTTFT